MPPRRSQNSSGGLLRYVIVGGLVGIGVLFFFLDIVHKFHDNVQESLSQPEMAGAPVLSQPGVSRQSPSLRRAAENRDRDFDRSVLAAWSGMRTSNGKNRESGPFPNLGGSVKNVKFRYADMLPEVDLSSYPPSEPLLDIIKRWNPDDSDNIPNPFYERLQVFNYSDEAERAMAEAYREAEVPFKVYGVPEMDEVVKKWDDEYLSKHLSKSKMALKVEKSEDNHFMYNVKRRYTGNLGKWDPRVTDVRGVSFDDWLKMARDGDEHGIAPDEPHHYITLGVPAGRLVAESPRLQQFISSDLSLFSTTKKNFFVQRVDMNKGIQCRIGMKGVIAAAHYDGGRNMVAMLKGAKRYILAAPTQCSKLLLIKDKAHPSYRHSVTDWSSPEEAIEDGLDEALAIDTIVHEGEVLYIPSWWTHFVDSLDYSMQCNTRSGFPPKRDGEEHVSECMKGPNSERDINAVRRYMEKERVNNADKTGIA